MKTCQVVLRERCPSLGVLSHCPRWLPSRDTAKGKTSIIPCARVLRFAAVFAVLAVQAALVPDAAKALNLVTNPSFEIYSHLPFCGSPVNPANFSSGLASGWYSPGSGTSDYFHTTSGVLTGCLAFTPTPHSGSAHVGFAYGSFQSGQYSYREFVGRTSPISLTQGQSYDVEFWLKRAAGPHVTPIGMVLQTSPVFSYSGGPPPQIVANIVPSGGYQKVSGLFVAPTTGSYYFQIGPWNQGVWTSLNYFFVDDVSIVPSPVSDGWISDSPVFDSSCDTGVEPEACNIIYLSDDIRVLYSPGLGLNAFTPAYPHQNAIAGGTNYVYVKLRNRGNSPVSGEIRVYWAKASTGLPWDPNNDNWNPSVPNNCPAPPCGGQIGTSATITLSPNSMEVAEFSWLAPPAAPGWDGHTCLLARFVSVQDPMFPPGETTSIADNTRNINNIAWKNLTVVEPLPPDADPLGDGFLVRNVKDVDASVDLVFNAAGGGGGIPFLAAGSVRVVLTPEMFSNWQGAGGQGQGIIANPNDYSVSLTSSPAKIEGIPMEAFEAHLVTMYFTPEGGSPPPVFQRFLVEQFSDGQGLDGGVGFEFRFGGPPCEPLPDGSGCRPTVCPDQNDTCRPTERVSDPVSGRVTVTKCGCVSSDECSVAFGSEFQPPLPPILFCQGSACPEADQPCQLTGTPNPVDGTTTFECCPCSQTPEACCRGGVCEMRDPRCCLADGGFPTGPGTQCTEPQACCHRGGGCEFLDPLCCIFAATGTPVGPPGSICQGDLNGDGIDDACAPTTCPTPLAPALDICGPRLAHGDCQNGGPDDICRPTQLSFDPLTERLTADKCECVNSDECYLARPQPNVAGAPGIMCFGSVCPGTNQPCELTSTSNPDGTITFDCCANFCQLKDQTPTDPCASLQTRDCRDSEPGQLCRPKCVEIIRDPDEALRLIATECDCVEPSACGPVEITPVGTDNTSLSCLGACPSPDDPCEVFLNGVPVGQVSLLLSNLTLGDEVCCRCEACSNPHQACCLPDGTCVNDDPVCCELQNGDPQGPGTSCQGLEACCLPDGTCRVMDKQCCIRGGGTPLGLGSLCLGDTNGDGIDDACCDEDPANDVVINLSTAVGGTPAVPDCIAAGSPDDTWTVTVDPSGGSVPRPAIVVDKYPGWHSLPHSCTWISLDANHGNGAPSGDYHYESCFCLNDGFQNASLSFDILADDSADVFLNNSLGKHHLVATPALGFHLPATHFSSTPATPFVAGNNCIKVVVHQTQGVVTGFEMTGQFRAEDARCCCEPLPSGFGCDKVICPDERERCIPTLVSFDPCKGPTFGFTTLDCECQQPNQCRLVEGPNGPTCLGSCPLLKSCRLSSSGVVSDGTFEYSCDCGDPDTLAGDVDNDGDVDLVDYAIIQNKFTGPRD